MQDRGIMTLDEFLKTRSQMQGKTTELLVAEQQAAYERAKASRDLAARANIKEEARIERENKKKTTSKTTPKTQTSLGYVTGGGLNAFGSKVTLPGTSTARGTVSPEEAARWAAGLGLGSNKNVQPIMTVPGVGGVYPSAPVAKPAPTPTPKKPLVSKRRFGYVHGVTENDLRNLANASGFDLNKFNLRSYDGIAALQRALGVKVDGYVGRDTLKAMRDIYGNKLVNSFAANAAATDAGPIVKEVPNLNASFDLAYVPNAQLSFKTGGRVNYFGAGGAAASMQLQVAQLVQAAQAGDEKAAQTINQIMQAAQQGDPQAEELKAMIEQLLGTPAAKHGTKLSYLHSLNTGCPEGTEPHYYKVGGKVCKECLEAEVLKCGGKTKKAKCGTSAPKVKVDKCGGKAKKKCYFGGTF